MARSRLPPASGTRPRHRCSLDVGFLREIQVTAIACDSPAKAAFRFPSVLLPFRFTLCLWADRGFRQILTPD